MENSTKALLIAAGVLIVIVLIALGLSILNSGQDTKDQVASTSESLSLQTESAKDSATLNLETLSMNGIERFNYQFEQYFGENVNGENAKKLAQKVKSQNEGNGRLVWLVLRVNSNIKYQAHEDDRKNCAKICDKIINYINNNKNKNYKIVPTKCLVYSNQDKGQRLYKRGICSVHYDLATIVMLHAVLTINYENR